MLNVIHITHAPGLSDLIQQELLDTEVISNKAEILEPHRGGLKIKFSEKSLARLWTRSRLATSALVDLGTFYCETLEDIYDASKALELEKIFGQMPDFKIDISGEMPRNIKFSQAPLKMKDAICDRQREKYGSRPSIDRDTPDLRIVAHFQGPKVHVSFDLFYEPLHKRGYRAHIGAAPIKENKAAALLMFAGYSGEETLVDPFCGSGTIAIEALCMQRQIWPGLLRKGFPSEHLISKVAPGLNKCLAEELDWCEEQFQIASKRSPKEYAPIFCSDLDAGILKKAQKNLDRLGHGLEHSLTFVRSDVLDVSHQNALWVTNPPYGERLEGEGPDGEIEDLMRAWGRKLKHECAPAKVAIVYPKSPELAKLGFKPTRHLDVPSGPIDTKFWFYEIYGGTHKKLPATVNEKS